jgi:hypothetical protein
MTKRITISYEPNGAVDDIVEKWKQDGYNISAKVCRAIVRAVANEE